MNEVIRRLSGVKILVIGDLIQDVYWRGHTNRMNPEAPGAPLLDVIEASASPGGAANVAVNVAALGGKAAVVGVVGTDSYGKEFADILKGKGIHPAIVQQEYRPTILKTRLISDGRQIARADIEEISAHRPHVQEQLISHIRDLMSWADGVIVADYAKGAFTERVAQETMVAAEKESKFVLVDPYLPSIRAWRDYYGATAMCPNLREFGECGKTVEQLLKSSKLIAIALTQGERGVTLSQKYGQTIHFDSEVVEVHDVAGCGDTFAAVFALAQAGLDSLKQAAFIANVAAGIVAGKQGTASVSPYELCQALVAKGEEAVQILGEFISTDMLIA